MSATEERDLIASQRGNYLGKVHAVKSRERRYRDGEYIGMWVTTLCGWTPLSGRYVNANEVQFFKNPCWKCRGKLDGDQSEVTM